MKTSTLTRVGLVGGLAVSAFAAALEMAGCGRSTAAFGDVELIATVPAGAPIDVLDFRISAAGDGALASGQVHAARPRQEFDQLVTHVPAEESARVDLDATSIDGQQVCSGSASFEVEAGLTTRVHVALTCRGVDDGVVNITIGVACAQSHLESYSVSPLSASVGSTINVAATAAPEGGALAYAWSAPTGTFTDPAAAMTKYRCTSPGPVTMTLVVTAPDCQETHMTAVTCSDGADGGAD